MHVLPNAETRWERPAELRTFSRAEIEERIGPTALSMTLQSGGLANLNIRIGDTEVLRLYRRDVKDLPKEATLLEIDWRHFRSPALIRRGADFLVMEYVEHAPLPDTATSGEWVGEALAEIHQVEFPVHGDFDANGVIECPRRDFASDLCSHARAEIEKGPEEFRPLATLVSEHLDREHARLATLCERAARLHGDFKASNLHLSHDDRLLVLDWEFAYAGPALMDVGQLLRWSPSEEFQAGFARAYRAGGGQLPEDWRSAASSFDLANLGGLLGGSETGSQRASDVARRIQTTLAQGT